VSGLKLAWEKAMVLEFRAWKRDTLVAFIARLAGFVI
jgi:hypothetical protein